MAKRLSIKHRKMNRKKATAYRMGTAPAAHKIDVERSEKMKKKMAYRAY
jgi:hypothetical protein